MHSKLMLVTHPKAVLLVLMATAALLAGVPATAASCANATNKPCQISLQDRLPSGKSYDLSVAESTIDSVVNSNDQRSGYWGAGGSAPISSISSVSFEVDGKALLLPAKSYSDLGNLSAAEVKENQHAIVLVINGGQSENAYYATFVFIDGWLRKRTVRNKTLPGTVWEKNTYRLPQT